MMNIEQKKDVLISVLQEKYPLSNVEKTPELMKSLDQFYDLVRDIRDVRRTSEMLDMIYSSDYDEIRDVKELVSQIKKDRKGLEDMFVIDLRKKILMDKDVLEIMYASFEDCNKEFLNGTFGERELTKCMLSNGLF